MHLADLNRPLHKAAMRWDGVLSDVARKAKGRAFTAFGRTADLKDWAV